MRRTIIFCLLLLVLGCSITQQIEPSDASKGVLNALPLLEKKDVQWEAQWIWMHDSIANDAMLARREFIIENAIENAELLIAATSQYQLFINGAYVRRGPARSAPHHQSFDRLDVSSLLKKGRNLIAIRVHHQRGKRSYTNDGRAGLLAQLELRTPVDNRIINTDNQWKVSPDFAWSNNAKRISRFQLVVNDLVDLSKEQRGWRTAEFDDTDWQNATPLMRLDGWPMPQRNDVAVPLTPPWTSLVERELPYLEEESIRASTLIEVRRIVGIPFALDGAVNQGVAQNFEKYKSGNEPIVIPSSDTIADWVLLFDLGKVHNAIPQLEIEGPPGTEVRVLCAPFIVNNQFSNKVVFSEFEDVITLSGNRDEWEATYFKPARYLGVLIKGGNGVEVKVHNVGVRTLSYPFERQGMISSHDAPWIEDYMEATMRTLDACTTDAFTDNYRERRQYAQTGYYAALGNYWTYGDHYLQRRYLVQIAEEQQANGIMPAYAPLGKDDFMIILDSNCLYIRSLRNYLLYSGDNKTVRELLPAAKKLMSLLHSFTNELGLIENPPYPYWLDHAHIDRRGANLNLNGHYLGALEDFAQVLEWLDEEDQSYTERALLLRSSIQDYFWNDVKELFVDALIDGRQSTMFSEHGNAMVLAMGIADQNRKEKVSNQILLDDNATFIKRKNGMTVVTPAMSYFLHKGLCEAGSIDASFEMFRNRFDFMLSPNGNGTLYEEWWLDATGRSGELKPTSRSDAQTESCFPPALFAEYLLGVEVVKPGMTEIILSKRETSLKDIRGVVPTPQGDLEVEWDFENGNLKIEIPSNMIVKLDRRSIEQKTTDPIVIDGKILSEESIVDDYILLSTGSHNVDF